MFQIKRSNSSTMALLACAILALGSAGSPLRADGEDKGEEESRSPQSRPTPLTTPEMLKKRDFAGLPVMYATGKDDATEIYKQIVKLYEDNKDKFNQENPPGALCVQAGDLLIKAMKQGAVAADYLNAATPIKPRQGPAFQDAFLRASEAALGHVFQLWDRDPDSHAQRLEQLSRATWALGQQMFEKSHRLPVRAQGLELLKYAGSELFNMSEDGSQLDRDIRQWIDEFNEFDRDYWRPKVNLVYELTPNVADILRVATMDEDKSFRIEATLALGWLKFTVRTRADDEAIKEAIATLKQDENEHIAKAATAAEALTVEDLKKLN